MKYFKLLNSTQAVIYEVQKFLFYICSVFSNHLVFGISFFSQLNQNSDSLSYALINNIKTTVNWLRYLFKQHRCQLLQLVAAITASSAPLTLNVKGKFNSPKLIWINQVQCLYRHWRPPIFDLSKTFVQTTTRCAKCKFLRIWDYTIVLIIVYLYMSAKDYYFMLSTRNSESNGKNKCKWK